MRLFINCATGLVNFKDARVLLMNAYINDVDLVQRSILKLNFCPALLLRLFWEVPSLETCGIHFLIQLQLRVCQLWTGLEGYS